MHMRGTRIKREVDIYARNLAKKVDRKVQKLLTNTKLLSQLI
jgi:hypothetical protein